MEKGTVKQSLKTGFLYFSMATALFAIQLMLYMKGSTVVQMMDAAGWLFFVTSCISHAATLALIPFTVLFVPLALMRCPRIGGALMTAGVSVISLALFINMQVYAIYRFHINGFILNMVTGSGAGEIFTFDTMLYIKEASALVLLIAVCVGLWIGAQRLCGRLPRRFVATVLGVVIGCTLFAHLYHIYAAFMQKPSVIKSQRLIPYYFPTTATGLMMDHFGLTPPENTNGIDSPEKAHGDIVYPLHELKEDGRSERPNILIILIDSWNKRSLSAECMPNAYRYASENELYDNHFSCSNGTRSSVFSLFFSVPSYYWDVFESGKVSPIFIDRLLADGYQCQVYPSAQLIDPPFFRVVFQNIPNLNKQTEGNSAFARDRRITDNFIDMLKKRDPKGAPFFSLVFYDLPHSFELTEDKLTKFQPSWKYADYMKLDNDTDPTGFFNLYRNTCYQVDLMLGDLFRALEEQGVADNTIVMITGDHGQEFNENHKNFWGHNGNFSKWQIGVPLICRFPGQWGDNDRHKPGRRTYRTTHYDIVATLMNEALGVTNPIEDYSMGHLLSDRRSRTWHVVGSELNYAFIAGGDTIIEKTAGGGLEVTDAKLNPVPDYKINAKEFNAAVTRLNRYLK